MHEKNVYKDDATMLEIEMKINIHSLRRCVV